MIGTCLVRCSSSMTIQPLWGLAARIGAEAGVAVVVTVANAAEALEVVTDFPPEAVLVEIGPPDRNAIGVAYELAELSWRDGHRRLPFIAREDAIRRLRSRFQRRSRTAKYSKRIIEHPVPGSSPSPASWR